MVRMAFFVFDLLNRVGTRPSGHERQRDTRAMHKIIAQTQPGRPYRPNGPHLSIFLDETALPRSFQRAAHSSRRFH
jgi:hypothetical protein